MEDDYATNSPDETQTQQGFADEQQDYGDFVTEQQEDQQFLGTVTGQREVFSLSLNIS
jgi:hypothetical protein